MRVHLLGFAKAEQIHEFQKYGVASFDTTSPLLRAFKDSRRNYYVLKSDQSLDYYAAIRVPQALVSNDINKAVKAGLVNQEEIAKFEVDALSALRAYDKGRCSIDEAVSRVLTYSNSHREAVARLRPNSKHRDRGGELFEPEFKLEHDKALREERKQLERTLGDAPWKKCACPICAAISIEAVIFRGNNRNRRRGFHNLSVFQKHVQNIVQ
jgi:hypothetical protein